MLGTIVYIHEHFGSVNVDFPLNKARLKLRQVVAITYANPGFSRRNESANTREFRVLCCGKGEFSTPVLEKIRSNLLSNLSLKLPAAVQCVDGLPVALTFGLCLI